MEGAAAVENGDKDRSKTGPKLCGGCSLLTSEDVQKFTLRSPGEDIQIRNLQFLDFLIYFEPGSDSWKSSRRVKLAVMTLFMLPAAPALCVAAFLVEGDPSSRSTLSVIAGIVGILLGILVILYANVDLFKLRLQRGLAVIDSLSLAIVLSILAVFGEEFVMLGVGGFVALSTGAYSIESLELGFDLNSGGEPLPEEQGLDRVNRTSRNHRSVDWRSPYNTRVSTTETNCWRRCRREFNEEDAPVVNKHMKTCGALTVKAYGYLSLLTATIMLRILIFLKLLTVPDNVLFTVFNSTNAVTLRDVWEFWVDILVVRLAYICANRLIGPAGAYSFAQNNAKIVTKRRSRD